jgi:hypothetical protein
MGTQAGVGISHHRNPRVAGREAVAKALNAAGVERPDFVFMFASVGYDQRALLEAVREATSRAPLSGCSGEGVIVKDEADESNFSVAVMAIRSDELRFSNAIAGGLKEDPEVVGATIGREIRSGLGTDSLGLFVFADALTFNFDRFLSGVQTALASDRPLPLFGGMAADNWAMKQTYQYCDDTIFSDGVACVLLGGEARLAWAVNHGCVPIGAERKVTRSEGNVIYQIDGKPVLDVLKEYLVEDEIDNWTKTVVNLCIGFKTPAALEGYDEYLIRFMPAKDDVTRSITIPTEVAEGTSVWMTRRDHQKIEDGVDRIADQIRAQLGDQRPKLVFQFDCAGRGKIVFRNQQKVNLLRKLQHKLGAEVPWLGVYVYGEIGPIGERNCFHNYTAVVLAVY